MYEPELDLAHQSLTSVDHLLHFDWFHYFLKENEKYYIIRKALRNYDRKAGCYHQYFALKYHKTMMNFKWKLDLLGVEI